MTEEKTISVFGRKIKQSDLIKLIGLLAFFALVIVVVVAAWPTIMGLFEPGGVERAIASIQNGGIGGVFILLGMQLLQIIVAFIPGEVVQVAAGMIYGAVGGSLIILLGCVISSAIIYQLVHRLGAPFVQAMVSEKHMRRFQGFENSGKLNVTVFILFLIPAFPKDVLTYIVPLSHMKMSTFLVLSTAGRIPGVVVSTYAASGLISGDFVSSVIIFAVLAVLLIAAVLLRKKIAKVIHEKFGHGEHHFSHHQAVEPSQAAERKGNNHE